MGHWVTSWAYMTCGLTYQVDLWRTENRYPKHYSRGLNGYGGTVLSNTVWYGLAVSCEM
jgi:hypothetical protein